MDITTVFSLSNFLVLPLWLLMIGLPQWKITYRIMRSPLVSLASALLYLVLVGPELGSLFLTVLNPDANSIAALLGTPKGATIAWAHFLAFDLFVGRWCYLDSRERKLSPWLVGPVLFLTLMLGPIGFMLYLGLRALPRPVQKPADRPVVQKPVV